MYFSENGEFTVNNVDDGYVVDPQFVGLSSGNVLMIWQSPIGNRAQLFDKDGSRVGSEFAFGSGTAFLPESFVATADGGFVASRVDNLPGADGSLHGIVYVQHFDASGSAVGAETIVADQDIGTYSQGLARQDSSDVAILVGGGTVVTYADTEESTYGLRSRQVFRLYAADGSPIGYDHELAGDHHSGQVSALADGGFFLTSLVGNTVAVQTYDADGQVRGAAQQLFANTDIGNTRDLRIASLTDGHYIVLWTDAVGDAVTGIHAQLLDVDGTAIGDVIQFSEKFPRFPNSSNVTALASGGFVVTWDTLDDQDQNLTIVAQQFDASGEKIGGNFQVSSAAASFKGSATVQGLAGGGFIAGWQDVTPLNGTYPGVSSVHAHVYGLGVTGTDDVDTLAGTPFDETIRGLAGDDILSGNGGDDTIDGGAGHDVAMFASPLAGASVTWRPDGALLVSTTDGADTLTNIEALRFSDGTIELHGANPLVDDLYYDQHNSSVFAAQADPAADYAQNGWHEGRDPSAFFSTAGYEAVNGDVRASGANPLDHYDQYGWKEGRDPSAGFDTSLYLIHNPDVAAVGIDPLAHYLDYGRYEGRQAYAAIGTHIMADGFDAEYYLLSNPDVAAAAVASGGDVDQFAYQHYEAYGWKEGRNPNAWFDDKGYLATYTDVAAAGINPLDHYDQVGWKEGRDPSAAFDTGQYLAHNPDVAASGVDPLVHYLDHGAYEMRATYADSAFGHA